MGPWKVRTPPPPPPALSQPSPPSTCSPSVLMDMPGDGQARLPCGRAAGVHDVHG